MFRKFDKIVTGIVLSSLLGAVSGCEVTTDNFNPKEALSKVLPSDLLKPIETPTSDRPPAPSSTPSSTPAHTQPPAPPSPGPSINPTLPVPSPSPVPPLISPQKFTAQVCPSNFVQISQAQAMANRGILCSLLGSTEMVRIEQGYMTGFGAGGCSVMVYEKTSELPAILCTRTSLPPSPSPSPSAFSAPFPTVSPLPPTVAPSQPVAPRNVVGDGNCPVDYKLITYEQATAFSSQVCAVLGAWDIARLANNGSMDGSGYGCKIRTNDSRGLGNTLCAYAPTPIPPLNSPIRAFGDKTCPAGYNLITVAQAEAYRSQVCALLGPWDIARLEGDGGMDGSGYGCGTRKTDTRSLGHSLCTK